MFLKIVLHRRFYLMRLDGESRKPIPRPRKRRIFSGEGNFQAKLKKPTQQTVLVSIFVTSALFFVTSASFWRHVFYREFAACFCVMFSGETEKKTSFQGPGIYNIYQDPPRFGCFGTLTGATWTPILSPGNTWTGGFWYLDLPFALFQKTSF